MAFHGFPGGPCRLHLLFHEQMKILPEAAEELKTDLTSVVRRAGRTPMCTTQWTHPDSLKTWRTTSESSEESTSHWTNTDKPTVADCLWVHLTYLTTFHAFRAFLLYGFISRTSSFFSFSLVFSRFVSFFVTFLADRKSSQSTCACHSKSSGC